MVRVVLEGEDLRDLHVGEFADHYVKCRFGDKTRTYTVREFDPERLRLTLDFVVHGHEGLAGPWAASAKPGDTMLLNGPGGGYTPPPGVAWHLMVGDESVIPAIAVSLLRVPTGVPVFVVIEVETPDDELPLKSAGNLRLTWLHRGGRERDPGFQRDAVAALELPEGRGHAFVHGEASTVLAVRRLLVQQRGFGPDQLSATGYWKQRRTDEEWRSEKREWIAQAEQDLLTR